MFDGLDTDFASGERPRPDWSAVGVHSTDLWTAKAVDVIEQHDFAIQPLFLYLGYQAPHSPVQAPPLDAEAWAECLEATQTVDRATFCAMVKHLDDGIGRVITSLQRARVWPDAASATDADFDTVVVFTTDNGGAWPTENAG